MNQGLFEPLVMFFGLCNLLATFQMMMNNILHPFIHHNEPLSYMDNILIHSASLADHQRITREILVTNRDACVTCHTRHTSVTDFRPKSGNPMEVTLVTSPKLYIVSHAKGN